jgi:outer membrane lipoprotein SlyB
MKRALMIPALAMASFIPCGWAGEVTPAVYYPGTSGQTVKTQKTATRTVVVKKRSKKKSAAIVGGSAVGGAVVGGLAGGKKGAGIGALVGGGGGLLYDRATHKKTVKVPE